MEKALGILFLLFFPLLSGSARADDARNTPLWKTVGDWEVRVDQTLNFGCFMVGTYVRGEAFRVGFDRQSGANGYIMLGNQAWRSLEVGKQYQLILRFDTDAPWRGTATARNLNGSVFLYFPFDKPEIVKELATKQRLSIAYHGNLVTTLPLTGTNAAVQELLNCQQSMEQARQSVPSQTPGDPFATGRTSPTASDPFAR